MGKVNLNYAHPKALGARYLEEARQLTYQQRFEKLMAIIEVYIVLKTASKYSKSNN